MISILDDSRSSFRATKDEPSDHSLLRHLQRGSEEAATALYQRYAQRLRALTQAQCSAELARRVDVEDIVQSVFGSFFRRAGQGCYDVPAGEELWKLFLVIALHKIRDQGKHHRAAKRDVRRTTGGEGLDQSLAARGTDGDCAFLQLTIDEALERLPPQHRTVAELRLQGYEVAEIARETARSKRTVERILQEIRGELRQHLETENGEGK